MIKIRKKKTVYDKVLAYTVSTKGKGKVQCELPLLGKGSRRRDRTEDINQLESSQARRYYSSFSALASRHNWHRLWYSLPATPNPPGAFPRRAHGHTDRHAHTLTTPITPHQGKTDPEHTETL